MTITKTRAAYLIPGMTLMFLTIFSSAAVAQQPVPQMQQAEPADYSEEEIETFVDVTEDIIEVQKSYNDKMETAVTDAGLTTEEFQQMAQQQQSGQTGEMAAGKKESFTAAMNSVMSIQQEMQTEMMQVVKESEMDMQSYQQMSMQIKQSPELSAKVEKMLTTEE